MPTINPVLIHSADVATTAPAVTKTRSCLRCETDFASQWAGERICHNCKQTTTWRSGVSYKSARAR